MNKRVLVLSDFHLRGSGYLSIASSICGGLTSIGYETKAIGLGYSGEEHNFNFSLIPCAENLREAKAMIDNLSVVWPFDILIVALDIPTQIFLMSVLPNRKYKYLAVTAMENGPLCKEWAIGLYGADFTFFISELGKQEAKKAGLETCDHLMVGLNTTNWCPVPFEDRAATRKLLGFTEDQVIVLTVADNQERKNLWGAFRTISALKQKVDNLKYILVTRINLNVGYRLDDLSQEYGLDDVLVKYERGMPVEELRDLYNIADVFFLSSKAEGLCLPVLEAMSCGTPVVATDTGALTEVLADGRGLLVKPEYKYVDTWGNSWRAMIDPQDAAEKILSTLENVDATIERIRLARDYTVSRTQVKMIHQLSEKIMELCK